MPYALIPDGYTLKKVTKLQKQAINEKRRHDDVVTVLNNPEIVKQIIITGFAYLAVKEGQEVIDDLRKAGATISETTVDAFKQKRSFGSPAATGVSFEQILEEGLKRIPFL